MDIDALAKTAGAVEAWLKENLCERCTRGRQDGKWWVCSCPVADIIMMREGLTRAVLEAANYDLLRRIAKQAATVHKQWSTWRGSEAWAMGELGSLLEEWQKSRAEGVKVDA